MNRNNTGVVLYANDGTTEIYSLGKAKHRNLVQLDKISDTTEKALISSEDKGFYEHGGFSIFSILGALYANVATGGSNYGGSTLTQQLAKNTLLSADKNYLRKFQELSIAIAIERTYSKDEILDMYLNSVFFGENAFGIEDAAQTYFGKKAADLDLAESAMLIGVLPAPSVCEAMMFFVPSPAEKVMATLKRPAVQAVVAGPPRPAPDKLTVKAVSQTPCSIRPV